MKIGGSNFAAFNISAQGLNVQRIKIKLISENIANSETTNTKNGEPYHRKFLRVGEITDKDFSGGVEISNSLPLETTEPEHFRGTDEMITGDEKVKADYQVLEDKSPGEYVYMPNHPDADKNGYVQLPNVNIINEMVEMINATRSYEANLTALKSSKTIIKNSMEI